MPVRALRLDAPGPILGSPACGGTKNARQGIETWSPSALIHQVIGG